ncbi:2-oxoacid ferredoxin oxidoreductase, beta subunit [Thermoproteus tenax Kra 1]|uniref:2-oxoacid oxidoreductase (ferredoxin) n=2 Tax=Thermoproteus tenax TaxID=2271 RepID=G4RLG1_THETK|nr:pyruvate-ferredoxin oxidoreductase and related 2-oxoacid-ferredoxin oxidoreductases beta subunit [Thermoproteus tenax]CCC82406.1 2-oxoacid ferredoxin oxidoreductase, beta subunit [Thermoproteus tenax Kra 1]
MTVRIDQLPKKRYVLPGNAACAGCGMMIGWKILGMALGEEAVLSIPASCAAVVQGLAPKSGVAMPILNVPFASAASVATGIAHAFSQLGVRGQSVVWAGDGGTADIGFAALSAAAERNSNILYIMYDNEAYMNTGIQRSSETPKGAWTTTTPAGKRESKKDVALILMAHDVPYVATASIAYPQDFYRKIKRASEIKGFKFIHLFAPCPPGWLFDPSLTVEVARKAVETGFFILWEYDHGELKLNPPSSALVDKKRRRPLTEYLKLQGRFANLTEEQIAELEREVDRRWEFLLRFMEAKRRVDGAAGI